VAQRFDTRRLRLQGEAFPVAEDVGFDGGYALADFSLSNNGILSYGASRSKQRQLAWVDRKGKVLATVGEPGAYFGVRISPDGKKAVVSSLDSSSYEDLWQLEFARGLRTRFTFDQAQNVFPVWSPDSRQIVFTSRRNGPYVLYRKDAGGIGQEERLTDAPNSFAFDWSGDGEFILFAKVSPQSRSDLWLLPLSGARQPVPYLQTPFDETDGHFSPADGGHPHWIAYSSDESGKFEVYVRGFPDSGAKWQVSTHGGSGPRWRADGKELFYLSTENKLMASAVRITGNNLEWKSPQPLFALTPEGYGYQYDVAPDGQRFLVFQPVEGSRSQPMTVIYNWQEGLTK
jgi:Tol biopolymer transport system component